MRITWAVAALLIGVLFVVGACTSPVVPTTLAPATIIPTTPAPVAMPGPTSLTPAPVVGPIPALPMLAPQPVPVPGQNEVWLWGGEYRPNRLTVPLGATVIWIGKDYDPHDVENNNGLFFASLPLGVTFNYTFTERGTFFYHCECNTGMEGAITVE